MFDGRYSLRSYISGGQWSDTLASNAMPFTNVVGLSDHYIAGSQYDPTWHWPVQVECLLPVRG